ncbi:MAG: hypothetical protein ACI9LD_001782, partial [Polaromonas sp.]
MLFGLKCQFSNFNINSSLMIPLQTLASTNSSLAPNC